MNQHEYIIESERTERKHPDGKSLTQGQMALLHAGIGMCTESAEFLDQLKKHLYYDKKLDETNLREELGDLLWYVAIGCRELGMDFDGLMAQNIAKLKVRFPEKFTVHGALNRDLDTERKTLEAHDGN